MIVVLTGGTGGAKFVHGLAAVVPQRELTLIVNTGDDLIWWGLHVSPDLDSITYALAGILSRERGWGIEGDTFHCLQAMQRLGAPAWFQLGDRDLATHLRRTELLSKSKALSEVTAELSRGWAIDARILPMSDDRVETRVLAQDGELSFQEFFVRERYRPSVHTVRFAGAGQARPAPGVLPAIANADAVMVAPSNPVTSIGPILAVPGIREALKQCKAPVAGISPIIGSTAVSGPAGELMRAQGLPVSIAGVVRCYAGFLDLLIADERDAAFGSHVEGIEVRYTSTVMKSEADKAALARSVLEYIKLAPKAASRERSATDSIEAVAS
jgi:LPPG:FO 2-phospho-L-lactate transferase